MTEKRLIDANSLKAEFPILVRYEKDLWLSQVIRRVIDNEPTVDAVEVVHGRWIDIYDGMYANKVYKCSVCGNDAPIEERYPVIGRAYTDWSLTNYCPNCGAKMDGDSR